MQGSGPQGDRAGEDRAPQTLAGFLAAAGWGGATRSALAGDASARRYERLHRSDGAQAVLMLARGGDLAPFVAMAEHLRGRGLSTPRILAADPAAGWLLAEDLGDALFARLLAPDAAASAPDQGREMALYAAAVDLLPALRADPPPGLAVLDPGTLGEMTGLAFDWYAPDAAAAKAAVAAEIADLADRWTAGPQGLVHRDYHAENLLWLPEREGEARVGILDFQDAVTGPAAYDLMSLLRDARRDVAAPVQAAMILRAAEAAGVAEAGFRAGAALLAVQRNLRILGIFARLCLRDGKAGYVDLLPRVWRQMEEDLAHPALAGLRGRLAGLPPPSPALLARLRRECGRCHGPR